jgi:hypothetical protein
VKPSAARPRGSIPAKLLDVRTWRAGFVELFSLLMHMSCNRPSRLVHTSIRVVHRELVR